MINALSFRTAAGVAMMALFGLQAPSARKHVFKAPQHTGVECESWESRTSYTKCNVPLWTSAITTATVPLDSGADLRRARLFRVSNLVGACPGARCHRDMNRVYQE
jgi:hypothetical protein